MLRTHQKSIACTWQAVSRLSDSDKNRIIQRVRSLVQKHIQAGVSPKSRAICHNCGYAMPLVGSVNYGQYRLCNDCALHYELAKAQGNVKDVEDFVMAE